MKYIEDKKIKKQLSKIGLGGGRLGSNYADETAYRFLDFFYQKGGTVIDTARSYSPWVADGRGKSEEVIGKWMEKTKARENVVIVTKGGIKADGSIDNSRRNLIKELEESLEALRTEYIDIYLLHKDSLDCPVEEIVETMQILKEKAGIRRLGVSNMKVGRLKEAVAYAVKNRMETFTVAETWWSLAEYKYEMWKDSKTTHMDDALYQFLLEHEMMCIAYTSQCKGYFQKSVLGENIPPLLRERIETARNAKKAQYIKQFCEKNYIHPTAFVNGYITSNRLQGIALVSCSSQEQLINVMDNCDYVLPENIITEIDCI